MSLPLRAFKWDLPLREAKAKMTCECRLALQQACVVVWVVWLTGLGWGQVVAHTRQD